VGYLEAIEKQKEIAKNVITKDAFISPRFVCGLDVSSDFFQRDAPLHAAAVVLDLTTLEIVEESAISVAPTFPYRTGLLAFREAPAMIQALHRLKITPDLLVVDGQGIAHPRRCGIACHLGVTLDLPSIGVGKSILVGQTDSTDTEEQEKRLFHSKELIGILWQSKKGARPLVISPGHRISFETALSLVKQMRQKNYRLPEPTRLAHQLSNRQRTYFSNTFLK
jgi:deoxyribonuclease V